MNIQKIAEIGSPADIEFEVETNTLVISNFKLPEEERGQGKGEKIMKRIIDEIQSDIDRIEIHIGLTLRDKDGYPEDVSVDSDPTVKFLRNCGFTIVGLSKNSTVKARKNL